MPAKLEFSRSRAVSLWEASRDGYLPGITRAVDAAMPVASIVGPIVAEIMARVVAETSPRAWAWLQRALKRSGERVDAVLVWQWVRNDRLRQWLEDNDNPYELLQPAVAALAEAIEADVQADADELETGRQALALLGGEGGEAGAFFRKRGAPPIAHRVDTTALAVREPSAEELLEDYRRELERLRDALDARDERVLYLEQRIAEIEAEPAHSEGDTILPLDEQPTDNGEAIEPQPDEPIVVEAPVDIPIPAPELAVDMLDEALAPPAMSLKERAAAATAANRQPHSAPIHRLGRAHPADAPVRPVSRSGRRS